MPRRFDAVEIQAKGGPSPDQLRDWRRRRLLEGVGELRSGRWDYDLYEMLALACAGVLIDGGTEIGPAIQLGSMARGLVFARLVEGTAHDNELLAEWRSSEEVVVEVTDAADKAPVKRVPWEHLQPGRFFKGVHEVRVIYPGDLADRLDKRFRRAYLEELGEYSREVRAMIPAERERKRK